MSLQRRLSLSRDQVAAFGSWATFRWIVSSEEDAFVVNAGYQAFASDRPDVQRLSRAQFETQTPWDTVRNDMYTFRLALAHLEAARPRVLTWRWARPTTGHTASATTACFRRSSVPTPGSRNCGPGCKPTRSIATTPPSSSPSITGGAGRRRIGANTATRSTAPRKRGWQPSGRLAAAWRWTNAPDAFTNQIAATGARVLGLDLRDDIPNAGAPIEYLWGK